MTVPQWDLMLPNSAVENNSNDKLRCMYFTTNFQEGFNFKQMTFSTDKDLGEDKIGEDKQRNSAERDFNFSRKEFNKL